ncbi:hypothetical protein CCYA_CCYA12G3268 [Cyanidiococcus yangmingshanensis]|nr:hypothetical protein CCYA_CCYA12G3268 [Cyanidiococcus yangmingshanensis]
MYHSSTTGVILFIPASSWWYQGQCRSRLGVRPAEKQSRLATMVYRKACSTSVRGALQVVSVSEPTDRGYGNASSPSPSEAGAGGDFERTPVTTVGRPLSIPELKRELLALAADVNRGLTSTASSRRAILEVVRALERPRGPGPSSRSATPKVAPPALDWIAQSSRVSGDWRLLFTTALDVILLGWSFFPLTPQIGSIYQNIRRCSGPDSAPFMVENVVQLAAPGSFLLARLGVEDTTATLRVYASGRCDRSRPQRLYLRFERARLEPTRLLGNELQDVLPSLQIPLRGTAVGWTELTFLDDDLRIIRTAADDVFVLWRD